MQNQDLQVLKDVYETHQKAMSLLAELVNHAPAIIQELMLERDLTQRELAEQLGVDPTYLSKVVNGRLETPSWPFVEKFYELVFANQDAES